MDVCTDEWMQVRQRDPPEHDMKAAIITRDFIDKHSGREWRAGDVVLVTGGSQIFLTFDAFMELFDIRAAT